MENLIQKPDDLKDRIELLELLSEKERILCENSFKAFFACAWKVVSPDVPLAWNWHIEVLCDEMQKQAERIAARKPKEYDILINVPPRSLKSLICTVTFNAWVWIKYPSQKFITASYSADLSTEHAVATRRLMSSSWYQEKWGDRFIFVTDQNVKQNFLNDKLGFRIIGSVRSTIVGRGANWCIIDDPLNPIEGTSDVTIKECIEWYSNVWWSRLNDQEIDQRVTIMQRVSERDLSGYLIEQSKKNPDAKIKLKHFCIPADDSYDNISPKSLKKKYINGLFFPARFTREVLDDARVNMKDVTYSGQMLQRPSPMEGGIFKRHYWRYWAPKGESLAPIVHKLENGSLLKIEAQPIPDVFDDVICSWDMAFKGLKDSDYVVGQVWGRVGANKYLLRQVRGQMDFVETIEEVHKLYNNSGYHSNAVIIEGKANGPAVISSIRNKIPGVIDIPAVKNDSPHSRAIAMSHQCKSGNIYIPHPSLFNWVDTMEHSFISEYANYPDPGSNDDQVAAGGQAVYYYSDQMKIFKPFIWEYYNVPFIIDFKNLDEHTTLYTSQWIEKNQRSSVILGLWNSRRGQFAIFDEIVTDSPAPEVVLIEVVKKLMEWSKGRVRDFRMFKWYGNSLMFGSKSIYGDVSDAYRKRKINVRENIRYNEAGAIQLVNRMLIRKQMFLSSKSTELGRQMASWSIENKSPAEGYGLCRALCNIVSVLWETGAAQKVDPKYKDYTVQHTHFQQQVERIAEQGLLDKALATGLEEAIDITSGNSNGWII